MRITLENFKDHVTPYQLRKGQDYFEKGRVTNLQRSTTGRWTATVKGREPYKVRFDTRNGELSEIVCDCIAQADNTYCKHVLAMLLAIEKQGEAGLPEPMDFEAGTRLMERTIRSEIREQNYQQAANRVLAMIKAMPSIYEQENDDVDQMIYDRVKIGFKLMIDLARSAAPRELKDRMYKRSLETALDRRWPPRDCDPHWMEVLMVLGKGKEEEVLGIVDRLLEAEPASNKEHDDHVFRFLSKKVELLQALNRQEQAIRLLEIYPLSRLLRESLIRGLEEAGDFPMIKVLAEHGIQTAMKVDPHLRKHWQLTLLKMAQKFGDQLTTQGYATLLYKETNDLEYYRLIKKTVDPKDWPAWLEKGFIKPLQKELNGPRANPSKLAAIYAEEQDWPRLLKLLQASPVFGRTEKYTDVLLPHYPAELLQLYRLGLIEYATKNKQADAIVEVCTTLRKMQAWPGGRKAVGELVEEFKTLFSTRTKLLAAVEEFR